MGIFDFLKKKASPEQFIDAAKNGNVALVKELLENGDVNAARKNGVTALMSASGKGHTEVAKLLIEKGADVNATRKNGWTALMCASLKGHTEVAKLLIEKGADVNATRKNNWTALLMALGIGHTEVAKLLIEKGADVNIANKNGWTALMSAAFNGYTDVAKLLIEKGADVNAIDKDGWTVLMCAAEIGHIEIVKLLKTATSAKEEKPAINSYPPYTDRTGVCDVCNRSLSGVKAYIVPNSVFYTSTKWRAYFKKVNFMLTDTGAYTDAYIDSMRNRDHSQSSAVCENCIHMF
ncbi:MAG: ankyrin repeat domain-containing protein [Tannerella sp.]|jgi:ankyrin repeat protein|nr:ankyrin repeat domain-containing protein [Tannerella sp.]